MEFIIELILELFIEGGIEADQSSKVPKVIRYPLLAIIVLAFIAITGIIILLGVSLLNDNKFGGILFILLGLFMLIFTIIKLRKMYLKRKKRDEK